MIRVQLNEVLDRLKADESRKSPGQRREVPTLSTLAAALKVSRGGLSYIAENKGRTVNLKTLAAVAAELKRRGFDIHPLDLFAVYESEE